MLPTRYRLGCWLAGLDGVVSGLNMIHADYDNDGNNDVFLLRG
ncbi:hypothetical protein N9050_01705 [Akkermansiaceae bacterium]|nr:hypothetical protein [Akkermansiaceae bacterium]MDB4481638.1 hypothetical protein [Akkermansiaceae bacterium]MDB4525147.1 hypothetical protein [bacterium]